METIPTINKALYERELHRKNSPYPQIWSLLDAVNDPEIPALSIWDLGILRDVELDEDGDQYIITITPTYSGCPAMDTIKEDVISHLKKNGITNCSAKLKLSPAWTTDDMTEEGRNKLRAYGIAPPNDAAGGCMKYCTPTAHVKCPHCNSTNTVLVSEFGSTACKALFKCEDCCEPFDFFKNI